MGTLTPEQSANALNRRRFVGGTAATAAGLVIGFHLPDPRDRLNLLLGDEAVAAPSAAAVNTWLMIAPDDTVTIYVARAEMGQGIYTAMPMLIAEELECDWSKVRVEPAPSGPEFNYTGAPVEVTGGSASVRSLWEKLGMIGATTRQLLIATAAKRWGVPAGECHAEKGVVVHAKSDRQARFGELANDAATLPKDAVATDPKNLKLKAPKDYKLIGQSIKRLDTPAKITGQPIFGIDVEVPEMLYGSVRSAPVFGAEIANFAALEKSVPAGVRLAKAPGAIIAIADSWWVANQALQALKPQWTDGKTQGKSTAAIEKEMRAALAKKTKAVAHEAGDAAKAMKKAAKKISAEYATPYLAHAAMEPINCTASVSAAGVELWLGTQSHTLTKIFAAQAAQVPQEKITVHTTYLGGGFGRRAESDMVIQAIAASTAAGKPVKVLWTREEDIQHDFYRPASLVKLEAGLDQDGMPVAFTAQIANSSIIERWPAFGTPKDGVDFTSVEGLRDIKYACANQKIEWAKASPGVPVGFWRSVGSSHNAFFLESFVDEMAHAAKQDPVKFRRTLLTKAGEKRFVVALDRVTKMAEWERPLAKGRARGVAIHESFGSIVAEVVEASIENGKARVHKVWVAVDCGRHVNPDTVVAQMESCVVYGLSAALYGEITLKDGRVMQSNFHDYPMLAPGDMPEIAVEIIQNEEPPGGVGEPGTPPVAPALTNAIFALTGKRIRTLPISKHKLV